MIRVRTDTHADSDRLIEIRHAAFSAHAPEAYSPQEVENLLDDLDQSEIVEMIDERQLFAAVDAGAVQGFAGWKAASLRHVDVAPEAERGGIGSRLVAHAEHDFYKRTGAREISEGAFLSARGFYEANGYTVVRRETAWNGSELYRVRKSLP